MEQKSRTKIIVATLLTFSSATALGFGSKYRGDDTPAPKPTASPTASPTATPTPVPTVTPTPTPTPTPTVTPPPPVVGEREPASAQPARPEFDLFNVIAYAVGQVVDAFYSSYREQLVVRNAQEGAYTDHADPNLAGRDRFADRIAYAVDLKMKLSVAQNSYIASYYGLPADNSKYVANSLISHPLCRTTASTLNTTFGGKNVPSAAVIKKTQAFADKMNGYRRMALAGDSEGYVQSERLWSKMFMCLSYVESLTSPDSSSSKNAAAKYAPSGYRRPAGVQFYEDPYQDEASRLNIGLFQFTPTASGNIQSCIREWNIQYPNSQIKTNASRADLIKVIGSSLQTFNAFCAAAKVTGMFSVQLNTSASKNTHPDNVSSSGSLYPAKDRCVSIHFLAGRSYSHFGPFQNSTGSNLAELMNCTMKDE